MSDETPDLQKGFIHAHKRMLNALRNILAFIGAATLAVGAAAVTMPVLSGAIWERLSGAWGSWSDPIGTIVGAATGAIVAVIAARISVKPAEIQAAVAMLEALRIEQSQLNNTIQLLGECAAKYMDIISILKDNKIQPSLRDGEFAVISYDIDSYKKRIFNMSDNFSDDSIVFKNLRRASDEISRDVGNYFSIINKFKYNSEIPSYGIYLGVKMESDETYSHISAAIRDITAEKQRLSGIMDRIRKQIS